MKGISLTIFIGFLCFGNPSLIAQPLSQYSEADRHAEKLGTLPNLNVATITDTLTQPFGSKKDKARAIYYWIANNIALDPKAMRANDDSKTDPVKVIEMRKTTPIGFSLLFQEMASLASIRCLTVDGYTRNKTEQINEKPDEMNHSWNVVQLGQSPSEWYYVDAARGSGHLDKKGNTFIPEFTSGFFFTDRNTFNLDHLPDNTAWQLGSGPSGLIEFYSLPVISNYGYALGIRSFQPFKGMLKTKNTAAVNFSLKVSESALITTVELIAGEDRKKTKPVPMNFTNNAGDVSFSYTFRQEDELPLSILINGKEALSYKLIITE